MNIQRPIKSLYLTPGSELVVPRSIPALGLREVSNRCHFSLQIFKLSDPAAWLRLTSQLKSGADVGAGCRGCAPPPEMTCGFLIQLVFCQKKKKHYVVYWC